MNWLPKTAGGYEYEIFHVDEDDGSIWGRIRFHSVWKFAKWQLSGNHVVNRQWSLIKPEPPKVERWMVIAKGAQEGWGFSNEHMLRTAYTTALNNKLVEVVKITYQEGKLPVLEVVPNAPSGIPA